MISRHGILLALLGLGPISAGAAPLRVVSLHSVATELATRIGGEAVEVTVLAPAGTDPHAYEPSPADLRRMVDADLVLAAGLGLEGYLERLSRTADFQDRVLALGEALPPARLIESHGDHAHDHEEGHHDSFDPHWWHSVELTRLAAAAVASRLAAMLPEDAPAIHARARSLDQELARLAEELQSAATGIPADRRRLVTAHSAFAYLARDLGLEPVTLAGLSAQREPEARRIVAVIELIKRERLPALFLEAGSSAALISAVRGETAAVIGGELYADGLGPASSPAATYVAMMRHNTRTIAAALSAN